MNTGDPELLPQRLHQAVRPGSLLRTEATSNNVRDFGVLKALEHVPELRTAMAAVTDRYRTVHIGHP